MSAPEHNATTEQIPVQHPGKRSKMPEKRKRMLIYGAEIVGGLAVAGAVLAGSHIDNNPQNIGEIGFTPNPPVSSTGTEVLIKANEAIRDIGPYGIVLGLGTFGYYEWSRRRKDSRLEGMHDITHDTSRRNRAVIAGVVMGIVAPASGLAVTASNGANEPIKAEVAMVGADLNQTPLITQYDNKPFNPSFIDYDTVKKAVEEVGGTAIPYLEDLGDVSKPNATGVTPSAPILSLPNSVMEASLGISLPAIADCKDLSVVVGDQLGVPVGGMVEINNIPAHVVKTVDMKPGMGRVSVSTSIEQASQCLFQNQPMSGVIAKNIDGKSDEVRQLLHDKYKLPYSVRNFNQYQKSYEDFWHANVAPAEMNLIMDVLLLGGIALMNMQTNEILSRRKRLGVLMGLGAEPKDLSRAYTLAAQRDAIIGMPVFALTTIGFTEMNNASQYGFAESVNIAGLGAGFSAFVATSLIASRRSNRIIKKTNIAKQLRSGA